MALVRSLQICCKQLKLVARSSMTFVRTMVQTPRGRTTTRHHLSRAVDPRLPLWLMGFGAHCCNLPALVAVAPISPGCAAMEHTTETHYILS